MKHARIAAVVASLFALPTMSFAADNVTVYGIAQAAVSSVDNGSVRQTIIEDTGSRIGFKGEEDLGAGLAAFFKIESAVALDDASKSGFATREGWVGLKNKDWGLVKLGRGKSYFDLAQESFDGFNGNSTMINSLLIDNAYYRISNSIAYESPDMGGLVAKVEYGDIEKKGSTAGTGKKHNPYTLIGVLEYNNGPIYAVAGVESQRDQATGQAGSSIKSVADDAKATNTLLGGGFTFDSGTNVKLAWRHSKWKAGTGATTQKRNAFIGVVTQPITPVASVRLGFTKVADIKNTSDTGGTYWAIGGDYALSKRTIAYTEFTRAGNDKNAGGLLQTSAGQAAGERNNNAWTTGLIHLF
ncbi:porin [Chitinimonas arctica]|nr:porin [Chitinimonas arctica]